MKLEELKIKLSEQEDMLYGISIEKYECGSLADCTKSKPEKFNFPGVYILYDETAEIKYIGKSINTVGHRLYLHYRANESNSTFGNKFAHKHFDKERKDLTEDEVKQLREKLKQLKVVAFPFVDLESYLLKLVDTEYNKSGKSKK